MLVNLGYVFKFYFNIGSDKKSGQWSKESLINLAPVLLYLNCTILNWRFWLRMRTNCFRPFWSSWTSNPSYCLSRHSPTKKWTSSKPSSINCIHTPRSTGWHSNKSKAFGLSSLSCSPPWMGCSSTFNSKNCSCPSLPHRLRSSGMHSHPMASSRKTMIGKAIKV